MGDACLTETVGRRFIHDLKCLITSKSYVGKTHCIVKTHTKEHINGTQNVVKSGRTKFGPNLHSSRGCKRAVAFSKNFANLCRKCNNSSKVCREMKLIMTPSIIWQGDGIRCMKSAHTLQCNICMTEGNGFLSCCKNDRMKITNNNSDIYSSYKCGRKFPKFV